MAYEIDSAEFEQTKLGSIPKGWQEAELDDVILNCFSGATPSRSVPRYYKGNIRWITSGELKYGIIYDTLEKISDEAVKRTNLKILPKNTFLMAITGLEAEGTRGSCGITGAEAATNQSCMAIFPKPGLLTTEYLFHFYVFRGEALALKYCQGTKQQSYTARLVKLLPILLPPIDEQNAISIVLSDVDALIKKFEKLIAKKRAIKQGTMEALLTGKRRLPGFSGKWESKKLGEVCGIKTGNKDVNQGNPTGVYPFYTCSKEPTFSDEYSFDGEAILIAGNGDVGNLNYCNGKFEAYQRTYVLQDFELNARFLWYQMQTFFKVSLGIGTIGSSIPYIKRENIADFVLYAPENESEQAAIYRIISDMDNEVFTLEQKLSKYTMLKQGMMQVLLTGKVRLV